MAEQVTLGGTIGLPGPIFLRKLRRKSDWGSDATPPDQRASDVVKLVFLCDPRPYSLFRIETDEEFHRVIIGMNGGRDGRLAADSDFIAITAIEFIDAGIEPEPSPGDTKCHHANSLHHDLPAEIGQLTELCRRLIDDGRKVVHLTKGMTRPLAERAVEIGCLADPNSKGCTVSECM